MFFLFIKGLLIGLAISAPVGPIGVLCIQRSLHDGFKIGLMTGFGAALADGVYGLVAGLGITSIASFLMAWQFWVRLLGGIFLLGMGIKLFFTTSWQVDRGENDRSPWHALITTFFLTLTNPVTILAFFAIFAALGLGDTSTDYMHVFILVAGILTGSALWWLFLSSGVALVLHHRLKPATMRRINRISALILIAFGIFALTVNQV